MPDEELRRQLYDSFKNRAMIYHALFEEFSRELGAEKAEEIMGRAIYRRGAEKGKQKYARFGPGDLAGLKEAFVGGLPDQGRMFQPEILREDAEGLDVKFHGCPLREAWQEAGLPDELVATLCRIAARFNNGTFEAAGFEFTADTWQPGGQRCCHLHIRPGNQAS